MSKKPRIVIIGGGFGGLEAAKALADKPVWIVLIDKKNHHTFQPLLYQVATAVLSPGEIASPIRRILRNKKNIEVVLGEAVKIDTAERTIELLHSDKIAYDYLIVAAGARHDYFGHNEWENFAPGLKTIEDALEIRTRILLAFEIAEHEAVLTGTHAPLNFIVIGGGPTGVELAGAIAGIARQALAKDFKAIDTTRAKVRLFEGSPHVLGTYSDELSIKAERQLRDLGVDVHTNSFVTDIEPGRVKVGGEWFDSSVTLWATGVAASPLGKLLGAETDKAGRVLVSGDLSVPGHREIFVIGDMASFKQKDGAPVPGVAPAAIQMAKTAAANILRDLRDERREDFEYFDKGSMATIGRNKAIVEVGGWKFSGYFAWLMWLFVHILTLIGFRNKLRVMSEWFWAYFTRSRSALLITGDAEELRAITENMRSLPAAAAVPAKTIESAAVKEKTARK